MSHYDIYPTLYKRATSGKTQLWYIERHGDSFRTVHGTLEGKKTTSAWTECTGKNIGKTNETSPEDQAHLEVEALYRKKEAQGKYFRSVEEIDGLSYVSPMLAEKYEVKRAKFPVAVQPKLDGFRCIIKHDGMWTRTGKPIVSCPHIREELGFLFEEDPNLILDGELYNHYLRDEFEELASLIKQEKPTADDLEATRNHIQFHVYDCPSLVGNYEDRYDYYMQILHNDHLESITQFTIPVSYFRCINEEDVEFIFNKFVDDGYEGAIVRNLDANYEFKRTFQLLKRKNFIDLEFEVLDIEEGKGNWSGYAKKAKLKLPAGQLTPKGEDFFKAGIKGSKDYCKRLLDQKESIKGSLATVTFFRYTKYGIPYLPIFKVIRDYE